MADSGGRNSIARDRRSSAADRDEYLYVRRRAALQQRRAELDRESYDPAPSEDEDWTIGEEDTDGLKRLEPPATVGDALGDLIKRRGWDERLRGATALSRWHEIVGEDLAARCEPVRLVGGVLTVRAENQVWATQLRYMLDVLATNVESSLGSGTVKEVRVVVGPLERRAAGQPPPGGEST